ncbi:GmrSD restriction endonuclease domain-containing protein [Cellulosimicrobium protaetiae]
MGAIFKPTPWDVDQLVSGVTKGSIRLPDLQRPFVWPATKVRDLFDSMYRGYPVGELMFWDVTANGETRAISGLGEVDAAHQIVDGQQRLTSLYAAMKGLKVRDEAYQEKSITISFNPFAEKFDVRTPVLARSVSWVEDISTVFESPIKARRAFISRYHSSDQELTEEQELVIEEAFSRLDALKLYKFQVVHIQSNVEKRTVADIFVRINSEGVSLKAYDYILTWLSVFWPDGREDIENFAHNSRVTPDRASEIAGRRINWTPKNPFLPVETGHVVRAMVAVGQNRAKLLDAYAALQAKDRISGVVDADRQVRELNLLQKALPIVTDRVNWTEFIRAVQTAGFRSSKGITSNMNLVYSYVVFLLGRTRYGVDLQRLRTLVARWVFMSQVTSRYTGSSESQLQKDLDMFGSLADGDAHGFDRLVDQTIRTALTDDYWRFNVPQLLVTSSTALSPVYQCYLAALNILDADMFMLGMKVRDWMDPALPAVKGLEGHHLFPRAYQQNVLGATDTKRINQVANFAPTDWDTNIAISDRPPASYWPELVAERGSDSAWLAKQHYWHALPEGWEHMEYDEFLETRRQRISTVIHDAFALLSGTDAHLPLETVAAEVNAPEMVSLADLLETGILKPGDLLDPVDPDWQVDAVVSEDGTIVIDGLHEFDTLDDAARHLEVTNISGLEFWALERDGGVAPLTEVVAEHAA